MRKLILTSLLFAIVATPCLALQQDYGSSLADGQRVKVYDKYGSYQGRYEKDGNKVKSYDKTGSYQGYSTQSGNKTKYYNKTGSYQGYSKKQ